MTFTYTLGIPNANNDPSFDQPNMQVNNDSINTLINIDHVSFNNSDGGKHKQVTFNGNNAAGATTGQQSVIYTGAGTADAGHPQVFWRDSVATTNFLMTGIRAWALCSSAGIVSSQSFNVTSVVQSAADTLTITLAVGACNSTNYSIFISQTGIFTPDTYNITSATSFTIQYGSGIPTRVSFLVMQI